ncbi:Multidrug resistance efflux pump [Wenxinia marina DSM 24838]|uniref:Multidrug resistance efflux pump n=1 Tax=Wenxinia marina DSM 24838 TaxID=1123501 RepID=A0A0D0QEY5_9RHOB|nr:Multidrug resistance efflux pump [Wenxinia marina DSM 24838]
MRFLRRTLVGIFLMSLTLALLIYAGQTVWSAVESRMNAEPRAFPQRERVATVVTTTIEPETLSPTLTVFGELRSRRTLALRTPVGGTLDSLSDSVVEGGQVAEGETLLRIDPAEAEDQLARARADLSDAEAERRDAERARRLADDVLAAAEAQAALRETALARQRDLQSRGIGTAPDLEAAELAASAAAQSVLSARESIATAEARIDGAATSVARAGIAVAEAERAVEGTEIVAPFAGRLADVAVSPGSRVTANEQIATLVDPAALEVAFRVSAAQYARLIEEGDLISAPVRVMLDVDGLDLVAEGRITREAATVGEGQTGRLIFARVERAPGFRPGDFVTVLIEEPQIENVARLPGAAVGADGTVLVIGEDQRLVSAPVELLRRQGDDVLVRADDLAGADHRGGALPAPAPG